MEIPVLDFSVFQLGVEDVSDQALQKLCAEIKAAFTEVGFVFLKNTGVSQGEVDAVMVESMKFFLLPDDQKRAFSRNSFPNNANHGWVSLELERLNPQRPGDLKEAFNAASFHPDIKWPSPEFQKVQTSFFQKCTELSLRVLRVMALSLDLHPSVFLDAHRLIGTDKNGTTLRSLFYPPLKSEEAKEGQLRCGEHSDYGSITLLFQSAEGLQVVAHLWRPSESRSSSSSLVNVVIKHDLIVCPIQVRHRSGEFVSAPMVPGAVLVNIADLMQRWTSDTFVSVLHRVLLPPAGDDSTRQSLAYFLQPDDSALITCCDGSNKYPPVKSGDYLTQRFLSSYGHK
ncbi:uncharacterized protein si:dkey-10o6.2 isoform X1 [Synchiropus splendidus]|uniref:uncharacterized protein si:dkey-10o6.2 isoform X1 n=1 Tax=Synchiropus splendidus TaxID=270530 RepID=UPI00237E34A2|nr:uncharacterized protein si:dkey-10o6.2 isoform X1 [Synchiropus splendidus]